MLCASDIIYVLHVCITSCVAGSSISYSVYQFDPILIFCVHMYSVRTL